MISKLDPRYRAKKFKRILRDARERNGTESQGELLERAGIKPSTYYDHLKDGDLTWDELRTLFRLANFTDQEILEVMRV
jgi:hypothetical protein